MFSKFMYRRQVAGIGLFACGLSVIITATALNIAHDRIFEGRMHALPSVLAKTYADHGKFGVTMLLAAAGLSFIALSFVIQRTHRAALAQAALNPGANQPYFSPPTDSGNGPEVSHDGSVVLRTRMYLPRSSLSGTTGWPATRKPPV